MPIRPVSSADCVNIVALSITDTMSHQTKMPDASTLAFALLVVILFLVLCPIVRVCLLKWLHAWADERHLTGARLPV